MKIIKSIIIAFSLYSRIPMPRFEWKEENMKHNIVFLPWIGAVIGGVLLGIKLLFNYVEVPLFGRMLIYSLIPLIITGGFHLDGYMDVQDALKSYKTKEEKLKILKDPHIGAFSVIRLLIYSMVWGTSLIIILSNNKEVCVFAFFVIFYLARAVSTLSSLKLIHARKDGMLNMETNKSNNMDFVLCALQVLISLGLLCYLNYYIGIIVTIVSVIHFLFYKNMCMKEFGGVTGDTAGFCITTLEECYIVSLSVISFLI